MKMTLKSGVVLEGTPEEMSKYVLGNIKVVTGKPVAKRVYHRKKTAERWTAKELYTIHQNMDIPRRKLVKLLPGRTKNAVYQTKYAIKYNKLGATNTKKLNDYIDNPESGTYFGGTAL